MEVVEDLASPPLPTPGQQLRQGRQTTRRRTDLSHHRQHRQRRQLQHRTILSITHYRNPLRPGMSVAPNEMMRMRPADHICKLREELDVLAESLVHGFLQTPPRRTAAAPLHQHLRSQEPERRTRLLDRRHAQLRRVRQVLERHYYSGIIPAVSSVPLTRSLGWNPHLGLGRRWRPSEPLRRHRRSSTNSDSLSSTRSGSGNHRSHQTQLFPSLRGRLGN